MRTFVCVVNRISYASREIVVDANDEAEAKRLALDYAGDESYYEHSADYECDEVRELPPPDKIDRRKVVVKVGDKVAYPVRHSSTCWLETGVVESFNKYGEAVIKSDTTQRQNVRSASNIVRL